MRVIQGSVELVARLVAHDEGHPGKDPPRGGEVLAQDEQATYGDLSDRFKHVGACICVGSRDLSGPVTLDTLEPVRAVEVTCFETQGVRIIQVFNDTRDCLLPVRGSMVDGRKDP